MSSALAHRLSAKERLVHVVQGEYHVSSDPSVVLTTLLGSCVATCLWDPIAGVGGMNHFLLPGDDEVGAELKYGVNAMELLINGLLQAGASRGRLQGKLFGGAQVVATLTDVGAKNIAFAQKFLRLEAIPCVGQSLGGLQARRVRFWPTSGRAAQLLMESTSVDVVKLENTRPAAAAVAAGEVELF